MHKHDWKSAGTRYPTDTRIIRFYECTAADCFQPWKREVLDLMIEPPEFEDYGKPEELRQRPPGVPAFISGLLHSLILLVIVSALLFILVWLWQLILDMM